MNVEDLLYYYGDLDEIENNLLINRNTLHTWKKRGFIPLKAQTMIFDVTDGDLEITWNDNE